MADETVAAATPDAPAAEPQAQDAQESAGDGRINDLQAKLRQADKARKEAEKRAADLTEKVKAADLAKLTEEERRAKELDELKPRAARADALEKDAAELLEVALSDVPEDLRDLVPDIANPIAKLKWITQAKARGLLAKAPVVPPPAKPSAASGAPAPSASKTEHAQAYLEKLAAARKTGSQARINAVVAEYGYSDPK